MILKREELKQFLSTEKKLYLISKKHHLKLFLTAGQDLYIWRFFKALRYLEYHQNNNNKIRSLIWERRKNRLGLKMGIFIQPNSVGCGTRIWHHGDIIVHKEAVIGNNCQFHGMNCIGNKGSAGSGTPILGSNINIGIGAVVIGEVKLADDITIAANAVVTESCDIRGAILAGVPARCIQVKET